MRLSLSLPDERRVFAVELDPDTVAWGWALLAQLAPHASGLRGGETALVEIGWATLRLQADAAGVTVEEPDYRGDPAGFVAGATLTGRIFAAQDRVLRALDVAPQSLAADQFLEISDAAMQAPSVVGYRSADPETVFTGWSIVAATLPADEAGGIYAVRELARLHVAWIAAMCLPAGWAFRFAGKTLVDCVSPAGDTHTLMFAVDI